MARPVTRLLTAGVLLTLAEAAVGQGIWIQQYPQTLPARRENHAMAYHPASARTVLFGGSLLDTGSGRPENTYVNETWEWDGEDWLRRFPSMSPSRRVRHSMTHTGSGTLLFGGIDVDNQQLGDVWEWDGNTWTPQPPGPPARLGAAMAYDSARDRVVLFGGDNLTDTWEFDGLVWTQMTPTVTPAPFGVGTGAMTYDSIRQRVVLTAGGTWLWDGLDWQQRLPPQSPSASQPVAFHEELGRAVLVSAGDAAPQTWEWNGVFWEQNLFAPLHRQFWASMAYDSARERLVMFGISETWEYASGMASFRSFGSGCGGAGGTPLLQPVPGETPTLGSSFAMQMSNLPVDPAAPVYIIVGLSDRAMSSQPHITLPAALDELGLFGCNLHVSDDGIFGVQKFGTTATWSVPIPSHPSITGLTVYFQGLAFDPSGSNWATLSNAGEVIVGR